MKHALFLTVAVLLPTGAFAQRQVEVRSLLNDPVNAAGEMQVQTTPKVFVKLPVAADNFGTAMKVTLEKDQLVLHGASGADPNVPPPVLASAAVPASVQRCILVICPEKTGDKTNYRMLAFDDSAQAFPFGQSRVLNFSAVVLGMQAGATKISLPAGQVSTLPEIKDVNSYNVAQTNFYVKSGEEWVPFAERQMQYVKSMRRIFLIHATPGATVPTVKTVQDHEPVPVPGGAGAGGTAAPPAGGGR